MNEENRRAGQRWPGSAEPTGFTVTDAGDGVLSGRIDPPTLTEPRAGAGSEPDARQQAVPRRARGLAPRDTNLEPVPEEQERTPELVRPYFRTRGRTRPELELPLEALVSTSHNGIDTTTVRVPEYRSICQLCVDTRSVAEVAACLRLPLGVARVLVADLAALELVLVHSAEHMTGDRPSIEFMERVLTGLRTV